MGNCCGTISVVKILGTQGELKLLPAPVTAAELMLDSPGYVVTPVNVLRLTRRVTAVKAEELLVSGEAYMLVPVGRIGTWVSDMQLAAVHSSVFAARKQVRRRKGGSKVLPEVENSDVGCGGVGDGCRRLRNGRTWTPVLEPIFED